MTLDEARSLYRGRLISSTALLYFYLRIRLAPGRKMTLHQREISLQLGISKAAFYKGIQRLKDKKLIHWEAPNGVVVSLGQIEDSLDTIKTVGQIGDSIGQNRDSDPSKTLASQSVQPLFKFLSDIDQLSLT
jgi:hypothetical protein